MVTEEICKLLDDAHTRAVQKFAQVLANCESGKWSIAQQAAEDVEEMRMSMGSQDWENLLTEATEFMVRHDLQPQKWTPG